MGCDICRNCYDRVALCHGVLVFVDFLRCNIMDVEFIGFQASLEGIFMLQGNFNRLID